MSEVATLAAPVETQTTTETPAVETQTDQLSPKYAALAKKEKMLRQQAKAVQEERASLEQRITQIKKETQDEINNSWKQKLKDNTFDVLNENGLSYEALTEKLMAKGDPVAQTIMELRKEIAELKNGYKQTQDKFTETEQQQYENAKKQIKNDVSALVNSGEQYETIKAFDYTDRVVELIEKNFEETGTVMSNEEACNLVEEYLLEQYVADHKKFSQLKKLQAKLNPPQDEASNVNAVSQKQPTKEASLQKPQAKTLSNSMVPSTKKLTDKERRDRVVAMIEESRRA